MRQPREDRALYYRQLRETIQHVFRPELTSAEATDAAELVDRILAEFIVEEEAAPELSDEFGRRFTELLGCRSTSAEVGPPGFDELRGRAAAFVARAAGSTDAQERALARELVDVEHQFLERVETLRRIELAQHRDEDGGPSPQRCSITAEQLTSFLRRRLPRSPRISVERLTLIPGGRSKETMLVTVADTDDLPSEVILRKDRPVGLLHTKAADEFEVIKAVYEFGGVPVPQPFLAERHDHGLGDGTFLLMARVPGHKAGEYFPELGAPTQHRRAIGLHLATSLARLHSMPLDFVRSTRLDPAGGAVTEASVVATVDAMVTRIAELSGPPCAAVPLARRWLIDNVSLVAPADGCSLLQGDFGFHNMLVDGDHVSALVDWEGATIGAPARELAAAWNPVTALLPWSQFVDAYLGAGGPAAATEPSAVGYYRLLAALGAFLTSRTGGHLFRTGAKRDLLTAHSGLDAHFRCARNLARALADVLG